MRQKAGIDIQHVPYRGGGAAVNDLLGGHIGMAFLCLSAAVPHLNTGKISMIAMVEKTRYAAMPDIPTIGETVPGFEMSSWIGLFAPAGTPADVIAKLNDGVARVLTADAVKEKLANLGLVVVAGKPEELAERRDGRPEGARRAGEGRRDPTGVADLSPRPQRFEAPAECLWPLGEQAARDALRGLRVRGLARRINGVRRERHGASAPMRRREAAQHREILERAEPVAQPLRLRDPQPAEFRPQRLDQFHLVAVRDHAAAQVVQHLRLDLRQSFRGVLARELVCSASSRARPRTSLVERPGSPTAAPAASSAISSRARIAWSASRPRADA